MSIELQTKQIISYSSIKELLTLEEQERLDDELNKDFSWGCNDLTGVYFPNFLTICFEVFNSFEDVKQKIEKNLLSLENKNNIYIDLES